MVLAQLARINAPTILMKLVTLIMMHTGPLYHEFDMCEYFAGEMADSRLK